MSILTVLPLDLKGVLPSNHIRDERVFMTRVDGRTNRVIIPPKGIFYNDADVKVKVGNRSLTKGVEYTTTYLYTTIHDLTGKEACAFIIVTDPTVPDEVTIDYRAVGGPFGLDADEIASLLESVSSDDFRNTYDSIAGKPKAFNPAPHVDEYWQLYGAENTITVIDRLKHLAPTGDNAIVGMMTEYSDHYEQFAIDMLERERLLLVNHMADMNNPHADNKVTVGLSNIFNWRTATNEEHLSDLINDKYAVASGGIHAINNGVAIALAEHMYDRNNPHQTRAVDINAYTTSAFDALINGKLHVEGTAVNATLMFGETTAAWKTDNMRWFNGYNITSDLFNPARLGTGTANANTVLLGTGRWATVQSLVTAMNIRTAGNSIYWDIPGIQYPSALANPGARTMRMTHPTQEVFSVTPPAEVTLVSDGGFNVMQQLALVFGNEEFYPAGTIATVLYPTVPTRNTEMYFRETDGTWSLTYN